MKVFVTKLLTTLKIELIKIDMLWGIQKTIKRMPFTYPQITRQSPQSVFHCSVHRLKVNPQAASCTIEIVLFFFVKKTKKITEENGAKANIRTWKHENCTFWASTTKHHFAYTKRWKYPQFVVSLREQHYATYRTFNYKELKVVQWRKFLIFFSTFSNSNFVTLSVGTQFTRI